MPRPYLSLVHLYIHVPFCARRCSYCDFAIAVRRVVPSERFVAAIAGEWALRRSHPFGDATSRVETIYFGGGTPSRLAPEVIGELVELIRSDRETAPDAEITLEANPDDVTPEASSAWAAAGVNRVSLGVQSFDPDVLAWMHRTHHAEQVAPAMESLRGAGISNLSLDLIFALPPELGRDWARDLDAALALDPSHLSLYGLTVEPRTPLGRWTDRGEVSPTAEGAYAEEFLHTTHTLAAAGWDHYEVSNAARPGFRSRHNSAYWRRATFIGLGPSAHSGAGSERHWNIREWEAYARAVEAGRSPIEGSEQLSADAIRMEDLYLGLRTREGAHARWIPASTREAWIREGWAREVGDRLELTPEGWLRLDALVARVA
ncbi:MAG TPA: radical SAM family heme chaperone HemW [Gemmatimonadales bacterium]|nr:radical SAM family heme chaperone HemW [Gemmatimonadales bacterium]